MIVLTIHGSVNVVIIDVFLEKHSLQIPLPEATGTVQLTSLCLYHVCLSIIIVSEVTWTNMTSNMRLSF